MQSWIFFFLGSSSTVALAHGNTAGPSELTGFSPQIRRIFPSGEPVQPRKILVFWTYDITIGLGTRFMDVSVTYANYRISPLNSLDFFLWINLV